MSVTLLSSGCQPLVNNVHFYVGTESERCAYYQERIRKVLEEQRRNIEYVVLAGKWDSTPERLSKSHKNDYQIFSQKLEETIKYLTSLKKRVIILGQVPDFQATMSNPKKCIESGYAPIAAIKNYFSHRPSYKKSCIEYQRTNAIPEYSY